MKTLPSRILAGAVVAALASVCVIAAPAQALPTLTTVVMGELTFTYDAADPSAGATITAFSGYPGLMYLPEGIGVDAVYYPVTAIGPSAFLMAGLTSVNIPSGVTSIGDSAFRSNDLASVGIPDGVTSIGAGAFNGNRLTWVTIPDGVTYVGEYAFEGNDLASVTLPGSLTSLDQAVFANNELTSITLPEGLTTIAIGALANNNLTTIAIPGSVTTLGDEALTMNPLASVVMKGPVPTTLGYLVFDAGGGATPVVSYYARYAGYTQPTWTAGSEVYASQALVTATFDAGVGGGDTVTDAVLGADIAAPAAPTADGARFLGWSLTDGAGPVLTFPVAFDADDTIYALWEARAVTSPSKADAGDSFSMTGSGFEPGETVEVWLHSDPVLLTTLTASGTGTLGATLLIPSGTTAGLHQLVFTGTTTGTTSYDLTVEVVLAASGSESRSLGLIGPALALTGAGLIAASRRRAYDGA